MSRDRPRFRWIVLLIALLALTAVGWRSAIEYWVGKELRALAAAYLEPSFDFDDLHYGFPYTITLDRSRLTSPDLDAKGRGIEIVAIDSLTLVLDSIPVPNRLFRVRELEAVNPTLRLVRIHAGEETVGLVGFSKFFKDKPEHVGRSARKPSEIFEVRTASVRDGHIEFDPREAGLPLLRIDEIAAELVLILDAAGAYWLDFSLDRQPEFELRFRGHLLVDDKRLDKFHMSLSLDVAREQDHYMIPALQKFFVEHDIAGRLELEASGDVDFDELASAQLQAKLELSDASYAESDYGVKIDHLNAALSTAHEILTLEDVTIAALGGKSTLSGTIELHDDRATALRFDGTDLQIADLLSGKLDARGRPLYSGLLDFTGSLRAPLAKLLQEAAGDGRLSLRSARVGRLPVLSTIDEALDRAAETLMKREQTGTANLSLGFTFAGDHTEIKRLRMNDRWYGLRGHGDVYFDSRLDLAVEGGPIQRVENELGALGDVLGEITETILRARVSGTWAEPKVGIEVLRQRRK